MTRRTARRPLGDFAIARRTLFAFLFALAVILPAGAASVRPLDLDEIIDSATTVFQGTCTDNRVARDPQTNLIVTYTTFAVADVLKGDVPASYTIKQIGGDLPDGGPAYRVDGVPAFAIGQSYVVFMAGVSQAGFSSPIGLTQGQFEVLQEKTGWSVVIRGPASQSGTGANMLRAPGASPATGRVSLEEFKQAVRNRVRNGK